MRGSDPRRRDRFRPSLAHALYSVVSLGLYLFLVFERLPAFPLYFFCDEAVEGVDAKAILETGADMFGERAPIFFRGLGDYALSLSVYLHVPFVWAFGLNEFSVRVATACVSLLGVGAVALSVRRVFAVTPAWATFLVFATSPIWFLHSRSGFEYVVATSFFLAFGACYTLAFTGRPSFVVPAAAAAAAAFYSYTPARGWIAVALVLLGIVNLRVHLRRWRATVAGIGLLAVCLAPSLYVQWTRPAVMTKRLEALGFAELRKKPVAEQLGRIAANYAAGLDPRFWYTWQGTQNSGPMERHVIPRLPQLPAWTAPFALVGLAAVLVGIRRLEHRTLIGLLLASLFPASLVGFNNARAMPVGPLLLLLSLIGAGRLWALLERRPAIERIAGAAAFAVLAAQALLFRSYVLHVAPYAYTDYGFYGVQMGAPQVFRWIAAHHADYERIRVSHASFNSTQIFIPFYLGGGEAAGKTSVADLSTVCSTPAPLPPRTIYVAPVGVFAELRATGCPIRKHVIAAVPNPRGERLFEIITLDREADFEDWMLHADERRRTLRRSTIDRGGVSLEIEHSAFEGGASAVFDGNRSTLARTARLNPARVVIHLPAVPLRRISVWVSHTGSEVVAVHTRSGHLVRDWGVERFAESHGDLVELKFEAPEPVPAVTAVEIDLHVTNMDRNGFVHINEIDWE